MLVSAVAEAHAVIFFSDGDQHVSREIIPGRIDGYEAHLAVTLCPRTVHGPHKAKMVLHQNFCSQKQH